MKVARYQNIIEEGRVQCGLCPHGCILQEGQTGICRVRSVRAGELCADGYGRISSENIDPIEKKPLYHFYPGSSIYSIGGWGCNFSCSFCQNWTISQQVMDGRVLTPQQVVERASQSGGIGVAYTYNEPLISFEFIYDCAVAARNAGLKNVLVTNGYINRDSAAELLPVIDALNIDIKSMEDSFYIEQCGGHVQPVLDFAIQAVESGAHVEITNLIIPGLNDGGGQIEMLAKWVAEKLGRETPLHLSAYFPQYKLHNPATTKMKVMSAVDLARKHLKNVYAGNVQH